MQFITKTAWENDLSDLVVVSSEMDKVMLSTYNPYNGRTCENHTAVIYSPNANAFPKKYSFFTSAQLKQRIYLYFILFSMIT